MVYRIAKCKHTKLNILQIKTDSGWLCLHCETRSQELLELKLFKKKGLKMNIYELKRLHLEKAPKSHFFSYRTMRFFGDTLANFGVKKLCTNTYSVYRKKPVKHGLNSGYEFNIFTGSIKRVEK